MNLSFFNANWFRSYPVKAGSSFVSQAGDALPKDIIVGCRLTVDAAHKDICISKVVVNQGMVNIELCSGSTVLGTVAGIPGYDNQTLRISSETSPVYPKFSGSVIIGNRDSLQGRHTWLFDAGALPLEPSTITVFTPPAISGIQAHGIRITGKVNFASNTLNVSNSGNGIYFSTIIASSVASKQDKTAVGLTCANPVISGINGLTPNQAGNIDIYGITPVVVTAGSGSLQLGTPTLPLADICARQNLPPADNVDAYIGDITTATDPEWKSWPQYQP
jgi:hypothetical protein